MSHLKFIRVALCAILLTHTLADAQVTPQPRALQSVLKNDAPPGRAPINRVYVTVENCQLALVVPESYHLNAYQQRLLLVNGDSTSFITFRIFAPGSPVIGLASGQWQKQLAGEFPGAVISDDISTQIANHVARTFEFQWRNSGGGLQNVNVAFISTAAGIIELTSVSVASKVEDDRAFYRLVLSSLRTNEKGKMEPVTLPGAS